MKRILSIVIAALLVGHVALFGGTSTPFSDSVNATWLAGHGADTLAIANQRLKKDPNDIAGIILKLQYESAYFDIPGLKSSFLQFAAVGGSIHTPNFSKLYPSWKDNIDFVLKNLPSLTSDQVREESAKGNISGKPMDFLDLLRAAELDGLVK